MKTLNKIRYAFLLSAAMFASMFALSGCMKPDPVPCAPTYVAVDDDPKVFIMYDNIGEWFNEDVAEAGLAVADGALARGHRVMVFQRRSAGSLIYELVRDPSTSAGYRRLTLKQYAAGENNVLSPAVINAVVGDIRTLAPANHYGFAFGSHGMGWIPKNNAANLRRSAVPDPLDELWAWPENYNDGRLQTRYLAYSASEKLDLSEFSDALDDWSWDFILFDDCFMASVEAMYEVRHLADYFIASPTEVLSTGFPYDRIVTTIFRNWSNMAGVGAEFVDYYASSYDPFATVAVIETDQLDALAESVRSIVESGTWIPVTNVSSIQSYEGLNPHVFLDLDDYMDSGVSPASAEYLAFAAQMKKTVIWSGHTPAFYTGMGNYGEKPITHFSGLSAFIPRTEVSVLTPYYEQTDWYKDVYLNP